MRVPRDWNWAVLSQSQRSKSACTVHRSVIVTLRTCVRAVLESTLNKEESSPWVLALEALLSGVKRVSPPPLRREDAQGQERSPTGTEERRRRVRRAEELMEEDDALEGDAARSSG